MGTERYKNEDGKVKGLETRKYMNEDRKREVWEQKCTEDEMVKERREQRLGQKGEKVMGTGRRKYWDKKIIADRNVQGRGKE